MDVRITPLDHQHDRAAFSCGHPSIDAYLHRTASQAAEKYAAATFVAATPEEPARVLAFYSLVPHEFRDDEMPPSVAKSLKVKGLRKIPAILLAQLGVLTTLRAQGLGTFMLRHALVQCHDVAKRVGAVAVVTDPIDAKADAFYRKLDFVPIADGMPRLILPMATIALAVTASIKEASA